VSDFEKTPSDVRDLLGKRISQLGLRLEGSPVERFVLQLYRGANNLPVVERESGRLVGMVSARDVLAALHAKGKR